MLKKIAISIMGLILISSISLSIYKIFEPNDEGSNGKNVGGIYLNLSTLREYTLNTGDNTYHYFYFCALEDKNCIYVYNSVFPSVKSLNNEVALDTFIEYVDLTDSINNPDFIMELQKWGITSYPALVSVKVENNEIIINNTLVYDAMNPLNSSDIVEWLKLNDIYSGNWVTPQ